MSSSRQGRRAIARRGLRFLLCACVFAASVLGSLAGCAPPERPRRDVLLITIDTLRPDFLEAYGFDQASSPRIAELAAQGVVFENAIAAGALTAPAHASIMTGRFARQHSIGSLNGETRLEGLPTVAERFAEAGYTTSAFISNVVLRRRIGLDRGFAEYDDELPIAESNRPAIFERTADATAARAIAWLAAQPEGPVFVWLHLQDPHGPYTPPAETLGRIEPVPLRVKQDLLVLPGNSGRGGIPAYQALEGVASPADYAARYAEEILFADRFVGEVVDALRARRPDEPPIVMLTADHGESMGEQGWFFQHGQTATPDLARVPMVLVAPGVEPRRESTWVSHVDVAPTLIELAGAGRLDGATGRSLAGLVERGAALEPRILFCDTEGETAAYFDGGILRAHEGVTYSRPSSVGEPLRFAGLQEVERDVWRPMPVDAAVRDAVVEYLGASTKVLPAAAMEPEHVEQLRALGYVEPAEPAGSTAPDEKSDPAADLERARSPETP